jgi:hypothetical protein
MPVDKKALALNRKNSYDKMKATDNRKTNKS